MYLPCSLRWLPEKLGLRWHSSNIGEPFSCSSSPKLNIPCLPLFYALYFMLSCLIFI